MGTLAFDLPAGLTPAMRGCLDRAAVVDAADHTPIPTRRELRGERITFFKDSIESVCVAVPWPVSDCGCPILRTGTLREHQRPYNLLLELGRGKLQQLRSQIAEWGKGGLVVDPDVQASVAATTRLFGRAVVDPSAPEFAECMEGVLAGTHELGDRLARAYADHLLSTRLASDGPLPAHLSARLTSRPSVTDTMALPDTFTSVRLCPDWRQIEPTESNYHWDAFDELVAWAVGSRLRVSIGPIIDFSRGVPSWVDPWVCDLPNIAAFVCDFVETIVRRYGSTVSSWEVFAGLNHTDVLGLGEDDRLRLSARMLESCRDTDPDGEWVATLSQPFGDYLTSDEQTYSPYVFADTLIRAGYRLSGVNLDLTGGDSLCSFPAWDPLEVARILEQFGTLGVPLEMSFGPPPSTGNQTPNEVAARWTSTSLALGVASPHVRAVHWAAPTTLGLNGSTPLLDALRTADVFTALTELRPHLA